MKIRRDIPFLFQLLREVADRVIAFTVHHHQRLLAAGHLEHFEQLLVVQHDVVIGHEYLEGGVAVLDQRRQFLTEHDRRWIGNDQMKRGIDVAFAFGEFFLFLDAAAQRRTFDLQRERQHHGVAAGGRRARG